MYKDLAESMVKYIKNPDHAGVGLAAPQVGVNKRIIVVSLLRTYDDEIYKTIAMINPTILAHSEQVCSDSEGCLSVPGERGDVPRWQWIKLSYLDISGRETVVKLVDLPARIVQHEIDHLDGVLFTDKVEEKVVLSM
jgi:peptide deformylase